MDSIDDITPDGWQAGFEEMLARIADRFSTGTVRQQARSYLAGLLSTMERKNSRSIAEYTGAPGPHRIQRLLNTYPWDSDLVRDILRDYVAEHLGNRKEYWSRAKQDSSRREKRLLAVHWKLCSSDHQELWPVVAQCSREPGRVARGIAPPGSHRTEREPLGSLRSSHRGPVGMDAQAQCANSPGSRSRIPVHHALNRLNGRSRLYFLPAHRIR